MKLASIEDCSWGWVGSGLSIFAWVGPGGWEEQTVFSVLVRIRTEVAASEIRSAVKPGEIKRK